MNVAAPRGTAVCSMTTRDGETYVEWIAATFPHDVSRLRDTIRVTSHEHMN